MHCQRPRQHKWARLVIAFRLQANASSYPMRFVFICFIALLFFWTLHKRKDKRQQRKECFIRAEVNGTANDVLWHHKTMLQHHRHHHPPHSFAAPRDRCFVQKLKEIIRTNRTNRGENSLTRLPHLLNVLWLWHFQRPPCSAQCLQ